MPLKAVPKIPKGLIPVMKDLAKQVIKEQPDNIHLFAAEYFERLVAGRDGSLDKYYPKFQEYEESRKRKHENMAEFAELEVTGVAIRAVPRVPKEEPPQKSHSDSFGRGISAIAKPVQAQSMEDIAAERPMTTKSIDQGDGERFGVEKSKVKHTISLNPIQEEQTEAKSIIKEPEYKVNDMTNDAKPKSAADDETKDKTDALRVVEGQKLGRPKSPESDSGLSEKSFNLKIHESGELSTGEINQSEKSFTQNRTEHELGLENEDAEKCGYLEKEEIKSSADQIMTSDQQNEFLINANSNEPSEDNTCDSNAKKVDSNQKCIDTETGEENIVPSMKPISDCTRHSRVNEGSLNDQNSDKIDASSSTISAESKSTREALGIEGGTGVHTAESDENIKEKMILSTANIERSLEERGDHVADRTNTSELNLSFNTTVESNDKGKAAGAETKAIDVPIVATFPSPVSTENLQKVALAEIAEIAEGLKTDEAIFEVDLDIMPKQENAISNSMNPTQILLNHPEDHVKEQNLTENSISEIYESVEKTEDNHLNESSGHDLMSAAVQVESILQQANRSHEIITQSDDKYDTATDNTASENLIGKKETAGILSKPNVSTNTISTEPKKDVIVSPNERGSELTSDAESKTQENDVNLEDKHNYSTSEKQSEDTPQNSIDQADFENSTIVVPSPSVKDIENNSIIVESGENRRAEEANGQLLADSCTAKPMNELSVSFKQAIVEQAGNAEDEDISGNSQMDENQEKPFIGLNKATHETPNSNALLNTNDLVVETNEGPPFESDIISVIDAKSIPDNNIETQEALKLTESTVNAQSGKCGAEIRLMDSNRDKSSDGSNGKSKVTIGCDSADSENRDAAAKLDIVEVKSTLTNDSKVDRNANADKLYTGFRRKVVGKSTDATKTNNAEGIVTNKTNRLLKAKSEEGIPPLKTKTLSSRVGSIDKGNKHLVSVGKPIIHANKSLEKKQSPKQPQDGIKKTRGVNSNHDDKKKLDVKNVIADETEYVPGQDGDGVKFVFKEKSSKVDFQSHVHSEEAGKYKPKAPQKSQELQYNESHIPTGKSSLNPQTPSDYFSRSIKNDKDKQISEAKKISKTKLIDDVANTEANTMQKLAKVPDIFSMDMPAKVTEGHSIEIPPSGAVRAPQARESDASDETMNSIDKNLESAQPLTATASQEEDNMGKAHSMANFESENFEKGEKPDLEELQSGDGPHTVMTTDLSKVSDEIPNSARDEFTTEHEEKALELIYSEIKLDPSDTNEKLRDNKFTMGTDSSRESIKNEETDCEDADERQEGLFAQNSVRSAGDRKPVYGDKLNIDPSSPSSRAELAANVVGANACITVENENRNDSLEEKNESRADIKIMKSSENALSNVDFDVNNTDRRDYDMLNENLANDIFQGGDAPVEIAADVADNEVQSFKNDTSDSSNDRTTLEAGTENVTTGENFQPDSLDTAELPDRSIEVDSLLSNKSIDSIESKVSLRTTSYDRESHSTSTDTILAVVSAEKAISIETKASSDGKINKTKPSAISLEGLGDLVKDKHNYRTINEQMKNELSVLDAEGVNSLIQIYDIMEVDSPSTPVTPKPPTKTFSNAIPAAIAEEKYDEACEAEAFRIGEDSASEKANVAAENNIMADGTNGKDMKLTPGVDNEFTGGIASSDFSDTENTEKAFKLNETDIDGSSRDERDEISEVENFDFSSCGEDSLEAMYYRIRKEEIFTDKVKAQTTDIEEIPSETEDRINFPEKTTENLKEVFRQVSGKNTLQSNSSITSSGSEIVIHQISSTLVAGCDSTDVEKMGQSKNEDVFNEEGEEEDLFPGDTERKYKSMVIDTAVSETDSDYRAHKLIKDDFNISTAYQHMIQADSLSETDSVLEAAAMKIQAGARGFLARSKLRKMATNASADMKSELLSFAGEECPTQIEVNAIGAADEEFAPDYIAKRRLALQRSDAFQRNSTKEEGESSSSFSKKVAQKDAHKKETSKLLFFYCKKSITGFHF